MYTGQNKYSDTKTCVTRLTRLCSQTTAVIRCEDRLGYVHLKYPLLVFYAERDQSYSGKSTPDPQGQGHPAASKLETKLEGTSDKRSRHKAANCFEQVYAAKQDDRIFSDRKYQQILQNEVVHSTQVPNDVTCAVSSCLVRTSTPRKHTEKHDLNRRREYHNG